MNKPVFFIEGPFHGSSNRLEAFGSVTVETVDHVTHEYSPVLLTINGVRREIFVVQGYDLDKAATEAAQLFSNHFESAAERQ